MTNLKLSSKMHVMIIVSVLIIAIGLAMGLVFQFVMNGYFNYGVEYSSYNSVVVDYATVNFSDGDAVKEICDNEFKNAGVSYYTSSFGESGVGGEFVFKFSTGVDEAKIKTAVTAIQVKLDAGDAASYSNSAYFHAVETNLGGEKTLIYGVIAIASAVVFQFLYFAIRYKLTMAFAALLADVHNLAIFVSLLAITRVPVGATVFTFGVLTVIMTMIGCGFLFDRMRKNFKDEGFAKLDSFEQVDVSASQSVANIAAVSVGIAVAAVVLFVLLAISSMAIELIISPVVMALLCALASIYGTAFFTPAVYSRFKRIGDNFKATHSKKSAKNS